jgi:hypothetical protein
MMHAVLFLCLLMLGGCATWTTPSTYSNYSTPTGNIVQAKGQAAQYAAAANTSYNCPSCLGGSSAHNAMSSGRVVTSLRDSPREEFVEEVARDFYDNLRWAIRRKTNDWLNY